MRLLQFLSLCFTALIIGYYANSPAIAPNPSSSLATISAEGTADAGVGAAASGVGTAGGNVGASATGNASGEYGADPDTSNNVGVSSSGKGQDDNYDPFAPGQPANTTSGQAPPSYESFGTERQIEQEALDFNPQYSNGVMNLPSNLEIQYDIAERMQFGLMTGRVPPGWGGFGYGLPSVTVTPKNESDIPKAAEDVKATVNAPKAEPKTRSVAPTEQRLREIREAFEKRPIGLPVNNPLSPEEIEDLRRTATPAENLPEALQESKQITVSVTGSVSTSNQPEATNLDFRSAGVSGTEYGIISFAKEVADKLGITDAASKIADVVRSALSREQAADNQDLADINEESKTATPVEDPNTTTKDKDESRLAANQTAPRGAATFVSTENFNELDSPQLAEKNEHDCPGCNQEVDDGAAAATPATPESATRADETPRSATPSDSGAVFSFRAEVNGRTSYVSVQDDGRVVVVDNRGLTTVAPSLAALPDLVDSSSQIANQEVPTPESDSADKDIAPSPDNAAADKPVPPDEQPEIPITKQDPPPEPWEGFREWEEMTTLEAHDTIKKQHKEALATDPEPNQIAVVVDLNEDVFINGATAVIQPANTNITMGKDKVSTNGQLTVVDGAVNLTAASEKGLPISGSIREKIIDAETKGSITITEKGAVITGPATKGTLDGKNFSTDGTVIANKDGSVYIVPPSGQKTVTVNYGDKSFTKPFVVVTRDEKIGVTMNPVFEFLSKIFAGSKFATKAEIESVKRSAEETRRAAKQAEPAFKAAVSRYEETKAAKKNEDQDPVPSEESTEQQAKGKDKEGAEEERPVGEPPTEQTEAVAEKKTVDQRVEEAYKTVKEGVRKGVLSVINFFKNLNGNNPGDNDRKSDPNCTGTTDCPDGSVLGVTTTAMNGGVVEVFVFRKRSEGKTEIFLDSNFISPPSPNLDPAKEPVSLITNGKGQVVYSDGRFAPATDGSGAGLTYVYKTVDYGDDSKSKGSAVTGANTRGYSFLRLIDWFRGLFSNKNDNVGAAFADLTAAKTKTPPAIGSSQTNQKLKPPSGEYYTLRDVVSLTIRPEPQAPCPDVSGAEFGSSYWLEYIGLDRSSNNLKKGSLLGSICGSGEDHTAMLNDVAKELQLRHGFSHLQPTELSKKTTFWSAD